MSEGAATTADYQIAARIAERVFDTRGAGLAAAAFAERVRNAGLLVSVVGQYRVRACTHLDVDRAGVEMAIQVIREKIAA